MPTAAPPGFMTADQFFTWANQPENVGKRYELDAGRAVEMPAPSDLHGVVCCLIVKPLTAYFSRRGTGYLSTNDAGLIVSRDPDSVRLPAVMHFLESRSLDEISPKFSEHIPEVVVEVMSPSDRMGKTLRRVEQYDRCGVPLVWVVEPDVRSVHVCRPNEYPRVLDESEGLAGNGVLPDFQHHIADLFCMPGQL